MNCFSQKQPVKPLACNSQFILPICSFNECKYNNFLMIYILNHCQEVFCYVANTILQQKTTKHNRELRLQNHNLFVQNALIPMVNYKADFDFLLANREM